MPQPLFEFLNTIAVDAQALQRFIDDPDHDPDAAALTAAQKKAILDRDQQKIEDLLLQENPQVEEEIRSGTVAAPAFHDGAAAEGAAESPEPRGAKARAGGAARTFKLEERLETVPPTGWTMHQLLEKLRRAEESRRKHGKR